MSRRMMARKVAEPRSPRRLIVPVMAMLAVLALAVVALPGLLAGTPARPTAQTEPPLVAAPPTVAPTTDSGSAGSGSGAGNGSGGGVRPARPRATARPQRSPSPRPDRPDPTAAPTASPPVAPTAAPGSAAPTSPAEFDLRRQEIAIGFPLLPETRYAYRNNFLDPREGAPESYNHGRLDRDGVVVRLHDGIDIYAELGEPLVAPFSGTVIDPETRWEPWMPDRYGRSLVIVSDEPATAGYVALLSHMDRVWVEIGQRVTRGQVLGTVGNSGNADAQSIEPHVHFELRAPFLLDWTQLGHDHVLDAFNPFHSLVAADPKRSQ